MFSTHPPKARQLKRLSLLLSCRTTISHGLSYAQLPVCPLRPRRQLPRWRKLPRLSHRRPQRPPSLLVASSQVRLITLISSDGSPPCPQPEIPLNYYPLRACMPFHNESFVLRAQQLKSNCKFASIRAMLAWSFVTAQSSAPSNGVYAVFSSSTFASLQKPATWASICIF